MRRPASVKRALGVVLAATLGALIVPFSSPTAPAAAATGLHRAININGNVIAGKDGNYYRPDGSGGWEQVTRPNTPGSATPRTSTPTTRQTPAVTTTASQAQPRTTANQWQSSNVAPQQRQFLDNQNNARQYGAQRQQSFQANRPAFRGGGGGGRRR